MNVTGVDFITVPTRDYALMLHHRYAPPGRKAGQA